jgi:hypothetical protein
MEAVANVAARQSTSAGDAVCGIGKCNITITPFALGIRAGAPLTDVFGIRRERAYLPSREGYARTVGVDSVRA